MNNAKQPRGDEPGVKWIVKNAKGFNKSDPENPLHCELQFPFPGSAGSSNPERMPVNAAGVPVDANQAIHLMKNFNTHYGRFQEVLFALKNKMLHEAESLLANPEYQQSLTAAELALNVTYGVSFNKEIILKILSQTGCDGIRLYFCASKDQKDSHVSLVILGVDKDNYDLNYQPEDVSGFAGNEEVPTMSLMGEYGYPPDDGSLIDSKAIDEHYYLLQKAYGVTQSNAVPGSEYIQDHEKKF